MVLGMASSPIASSSFSNKEDTTTTSNEKKKSDDYHVFEKAVQEHRQLYSRIQSDLGASLQRLGEHHMRNKEYSSALKNYKEALELRCQASGLNLHEKDFNNDDSVVADEERQEYVEDVLSTMSSMGNVHSLRGDHSEAMKCYSDIMSIRASFSNISRENVTKSIECASDESDDTPFSSELCEDVKALDDLFRGISFRNVDNVNTTTNSRDESSDKSNARPLHFSPITVPSESHDNQKSGQDTFTDISNTHDEDANKTDCPEIQEALDEYGRLIESLSGEDQQLHKDDYRDISCQVATKDSEQCTNRESSLYMALIVYDRILTAQKGIASSMAKSESSSDTNALSEKQQAALNIASTLIRSGSLHYKLSHADEELSMYKQALETYTEALGEVHPYVAGTRKNIGMVHAERSEFDEAMEQFSKARSIYSEINGGNDMSSDVASALSCMGNVQNRRGEFDSALSNYSKSLFIYRTLAEESGWSASSIAEVTSSLKVIGMVYAKRDDLASAMKCFQEAMDLLGSDGANGDAIAAIRTRMGGIFYKKGQNEEAMEQYLEAYEVATKFHGTKKHPDIAGILHCMGVVLQHCSNFEKAMSHYEECVSIYRSTLGPQNPALATTLVCIGSIHFKSKNYNDAMNYYKEAHRLYENSYGPNHPQVAPTLKSVAMIHTKKGEYDEAMEIFQELLRMKCAVLGSCHPDIANAYKSIGNVHVKRGEFGEALLQYKYALGIYQRTVGESHPEAQSIKNSIVAVKEHIDKERRKGSNRNGDYTNARPYKRRAFIRTSLFSY